MTAREAWITGTILGLFSYKGGVPATDLTVQPEQDHEGNWANVLDVVRPDGTVVAQIEVTDLMDRDDSP